MTQAPRQVVFGLGSNLCDRVGSVLSAAFALSRLPDAHRVRLSNLYETAPVGGPPQGDFINAAIAVDTAMPARALLDVALEIEQRHGRIRLERFGPRTLDIDILWIDNELVDERGLQVPHVRLHERAFALRPLLDVAPRAIDPRSGIALSDVMQGLDPAGLRLLSHRCACSMERHAVMIGAAEPT